MSGLPAPAATEVSRPYWEALAAGTLTFQHCLACGHRWLPAREACPHCLGTGASWEASVGRGKVVSWVVYHTAYHDALKERVPYNVALVELDEGPRLLTNVVDSDAGRALSVGATVALQVEAEGDIQVARFRLVPA